MILRNLPEDADVDTTETNHLSFCAGYGGIDLGLRRVLPSCRTVAHVEIEAFAIANLVAKMDAGDLDAAPVWTDIKTFPAEPFRGLVDIISGGYPCQPFSAAGKRLGTKDPRHLWPFLRRAIRVIQPGRVFLENVEGHISLGLSTVISDLEEDGYRATWGVFSAAEVGASHQRKRVFIMANCDKPRLQRSEWRGKAREERTSIRHVAECSKALANSRCVNREVSTERQQSAKPVFGSNEQERRAFPSRPGEPQFDWEEPRTVADSKSGGTVLNEETGNRGERIGGGSEEELADSVSSKRRDTHRNNPPHGAERTKSGQSNRIRRSSSVAELADTNIGRQSSNQHPGSGGKELGNTGSAEPCGMPNEARQDVPEVGNANRRQAEPQLGGATDGSASRVDATANRVDRLRLLGNGVVPATAAKAWTVLSKRFEHYES